MRARTVYLAPPMGARGAQGEHAGVSYLGCEDLGRSRQVTRAFNAAVDAGPGTLVLCHRYRAYLIWLRSGQSAARVIALAHEFGFFKRLQRRVIRRVLARKVEFAGVSPAVVVELEKTVARAHELPNALDLEQLKALSRDEARRALGLPAEGRLCAVVGRLHRKKRPDLALTAFIAADLPGWRLVFVGDGELRGALESQVRGESVIFTGFVEDARRYLAAFDALLMTSSAEEAFGMAALEAMAAGLPVVAPRVPGPQSVLGECGYYFDDASSEPVARALCAAARDGGERAEEGIDRVRRDFSLSAVVRRLDSLRYF
ncbi:MAG: glycosyltransferase [Pseudomonadales bacterium]|nr:glycosyltransferase [Pseudomonadales bacterium]MDP6469531.1 glycosyltransferase [Pseudomonadales bacterium]MDP6971195.1 glycosyltransferase [Pseudomonadales bacterium]